MRLVKQVKLFFREGNSDKVYEIDLCDIGNEQYVVNFRYGRRGAQLKEGTKTESPVTRQKADAAFDSLEAEKRGKGYRAEGETGMNVPITSSPEVAEIFLPIINWFELPAGRNKAILQRLQNATEGKENTARHFWKTSRVIWIAGVLKLEAAAPFIINLANKGNVMQQYASAWALGRLTSEDAIPLLQSYFRSSSNNNIKRIAGESLSQLLKGDERIKHLQHYLNSLAEPVKFAIENNSNEELEELLVERVINQQQPHYEMLEDIYSLSSEYKWLKPVIKNVLLQLPLKPNYFRHIRHIYKMAEQRDDFEILGALSCKFERDKEMFSNNASGHSKTFVAALNEIVDTNQELLKKTSRLAYSNKTRQYLRKRTLRILNNYGKYDDLNYVRMATGLLLAYDNDRDHTEPFFTTYYDYSSGRYQQKKKNFPANAYAVYLNQVISGNAPNLRLQSNNVWAIVDENTGTRSGENDWKGAASGGGILKKIFSLFGGKKKEEKQPESKLTYNTPEPVQQKSDTPFIHLWNKLPQAYVQLLIHGRMNEIHEFAINNLQRHPDYNEIKGKLDHRAIEYLLISRFDIPIDFGYKLALEKYDPLQPDTLLVKAMLYSRSAMAKGTATTWVNNNPDVFFNDSEWVASMLFCPNADIRKWVQEKMISQNYTPVQGQLICGRVISIALTTKPDSELNNQVITEAGETIIRLFNTQLTEIGSSIIDDLLKSSVSATQVLGLKILLLKKTVVSFDNISNDVLSKLLTNRSQAVREKSLELLNELSTGELLKRQELIMECCLSPYHDVRVNIRPVIKRMADENTDFGTAAFNWLLPSLLRKESHEGLQKDVKDILINELMGFVNNADKEMVLRLIYADYVPAQEFGIAVLEKYIDPSSFTIRQIIALGNHETLSVREWCWKYFSENVARIKYEREEAIRLLDAKWVDTRDFAKQFFSANFSESDWSPETLVGIADSVRPDIEAYGRELITRFFNDKDGENYLLKLSQHPGVKMQLFATNYLERFASGDIERIEKLDFYFRSVLSRVNKARVAKNRVFKFLLNEGKRSEDAAKLVAKIINNISATVSIEDKAKCIEIMFELNNLYNLDVPLTIHPVEERF